MERSILGPLLFNIFINDIFLIPNKSSLQNDADDTTLSYSHTDPDILILNLQHDCTEISHWFKDNNMQTNPDKFQAISFGRKGNNIFTDFTFDNTTIHCDDSVLLLGLNSTICSRLIIKIIWHRVPPREKVKTHGI